MIIFKCGEKWVVVTVCFLVFVGSIVVVDCLFEFFDEGLCCFF